MNVNVKTAQADAAPAVDPVTVEIVRRGLLAVTEEMKTNLTRTAYNGAMNPVILIKKVKELAAEAGGLKQLQELIGVLAD